MKRVKEQTYIEVISSAERREIAGRFSRVGGGENWVIVGTVGSLWPHDLNRRQRQFIAEWYFGFNAGTYSFEVLSSYPESTLPPGNFNGFIKITKH